MYFNCTRRSRNPYLLYEVFSSNDLLDWQRFDWLGEPSTVVHPDGSETIMLTSVQLIQGSGAERIFYELRISEDPSFNP